MSLKVYVAAPWEDQGIAIHARALLQKAGFEVTSSWLDDVDTDNPQALMENALRDIEQLIEANMLLLLNSQPRGQETSGKAVETGIAIALMKPILIVGERSNIFHYLNMPIYATVEEAVEGLQKYKPGVVAFDYSGASAFIPEEPSATVTNVDGEMLNERD